MLVLVTAVACFYRHGMNDIQHRPGSKPPSQSTRPRIAIIGSGIAGLSAGWMLSKHHDVTLYERQKKPGMGAYNLDYDDGVVKTVIDVPIRALNRSHYKGLVALYEEAGVDMADAAHSASYTWSDSGKTYLSYRYLNFGGQSLPVPVSGITPGLVLDLGRFLVLASRDLGTSRTDGVTFDDYMKKRGYSRRFVDDVMLPSFASICTCGYSDIRAYPAEDIISFMSGGLLFDRIVRAAHGADDAIARLLSPVKQVQNDTSIQGLEHHDEGIDVVLPGNRRERFDHVVVATQARYAADLVTDVDPEGAALLRQVPWTMTDIMVHTDKNVLPKAITARAPVTFRVDPKRDRPMASLELNQMLPQLKRAQPVFETVDSDGSVDENTVLMQASIERPLVTLESRQAMQQLQSLQTRPDRRIWYTGSYAMPGIPLQESAVQASLAVAQRLAACFKTYQG